MNLTEKQFKVLSTAADFGIQGILFRNAMARKLGLNITESTALSLLGISGISTPTEIAKYTGLTTGSTTSMLDRLEKKGYIKRVRNPHDRRGVVIETTEEFGKAGKELVSEVQTLHKQLIASYSEDELFIIEDFLKRFTNNVKVSTKKIDAGM